LPGPIIKKHTSVCFLYFIGFLLSIVQC